MHSTVDWLKHNGFEYLKVDSGGCYNDMQLWHDLLVAADWDITVENCHQGQQPPNATWCPYDLWRVGPDVNGIRATKPGHLVEDHYGWRWREGTHGLVEKSFGLMSLGCLAITYMAL